jgi:hypothetical protein
VRSGRFSVNSAISVYRSDDLGEGIVRIEVGTVSAEVCASDLIEQLRLIGAFAKTKNKPPAVVNRQLRADALAVIDCWNETFPGREISAQRNAPFAERILLHGYNVETMARIFLAIRDKSTPSARWIQTDGKRWLDFPHVTRPPYRDGDQLKTGIAYKILSELDGGANMSQIRRTSEEEL